MDGDGEFFSNGGVEWLRDFRHVYLGEGKAFSFREGHEPSGEGIFTCFRVGDECSTSY